MTMFLFRAAAVGAAILWMVPLVTMAQTVADKNEAATKRGQLEAEGTWRAVSLEVNGNAVGADEVKKITTENGRDGEWTLLVDGKDVAEGTSTIDPTFTPKTIDFKTTKGNNAGQTAFGIYEMSGKIRKLCIAEQGRPRPADFSAAAGSGQTLVVFERVDETK